MLTNAAGTLAPVRVTALAADDLAKLLTRVGGQIVSLAMIEADLAAGAPTNADGTINLVHYAAWLVKNISA